MSAIDLVRWLDGLAPEDREMPDLRAAGDTLEATGDRFGVLTSSILVRCRELGRELAERMGVTVGRNKRASP